MYLVIVVALGPLVAVVELPCCKQSHTICIQITYTTTSHERDTKLWLGTNKTSHPEGIARSGTVEPHICVRVTGAHWIYRRAAVAARHLGWLGVVGSRSSPQRAVGGDGELLLLLLLLALALPLTPVVIAF